MLYLQNILKGPQSEILRQVYEAQKENPVQGDWVNLVNEYLEIINMVNKESEIEAMTKIQFKTIVRSKIRENTLKILKQKQEGHIQISHINYSTLNTQSYFKTQMLNNHETSLLFSLRSDGVSSTRYTTALHDLS